MQLPESAPGPLSPKHPAARGDATHVASEWRPPVSRAGGTGDANNIHIAPSSDPELRPLPFGPRLSVGGAGVGAADCGVPTRSAPAAPPPPAPSSIGGLTAPPAPPRAFCSSSAASRSAPNKAHMINGAAQPTVHKPRTCSKSLLKQARVPLFERALQLVQVAHQRLRQRSLGQPCAERAQFLPAAETPGLIRMSRDAHGMKWRRTE